jgi:hypothetical protein
MRGEPTRQEQQAKPETGSERATRAPWRAPVITRFALARTLNAGGSPNDTFHSGIHP